MTPRTNITSTGILECFRLTAAPCAYRIELRCALLSLLGLHIYATCFETAASSFMPTP